MKSIKLFGTRLNDRHISKGVVLVGCQMDRMYQADEASRDDYKIMEDNCNLAKQLSAKWNIPYIETSAKENINIHLLFQQMAYEFWLQSQCQVIKWDLVQ